MNYNNFRNINLIFGFQYADKVFKEASNQLKNLCDSDKKNFLDFQMIGLLCMLITIKIKKI